MQNFKEFLIARSPASASGTSQPPGESHFPPPGYFSFWSKPPPPSAPPSHPTGRRHTYAPAQNHRRRYSPGSVPDRCPSRPGSQILCDSFVSFLSLPAVPLERERVPWKGRKGREMILYFVNQFFCFYLYLIAFIQIFG